MARVVGPLYSIEASGKFGGVMVFDRRGYVRAHTPPTQANTAAQGNLRQIVGAVQKGIGVIGASARSVIGLLAPVSYRWNSYLVGQVLGKGLSSWDSAQSVFDGLAGAEAETWEAEAVTLGMEDMAVEYADDPPVTAGRTLFGYATAWYNLGVSAAGAPPDGTNAAAYAAELGA